MRLFRLSHHLNRQRCLKNAKWIGDTLYCSKCKEPIAIRYIFDDEVRVYTFTRYQKYKREISERKDTNTITEDGDCLGRISNGEFNDLIYDLRQSASELLFVPEDGDGFCETGEGEESTGVGEVLSEESEEYIDENPMKLGFDENLEIKGED